MPDLLHTLQGHDLGFLKMVAGLWGLDLEAPDVRSALPQVVKALNQPGLAAEIVEALPVSALEAIRNLLAAEGRLPWPVFTRRHGEVRSMGAARRDRARPDLKPATPAEILWYRGLIGRAFLNVDPEPQEFAYIPEDFLSALAQFDVTAENYLGRPASPGETSFLRPANDRILDHACTLLAALRMGLKLDEIPSAGWEIPPIDLKDLLLASGLLDANNLPQPEQVRIFLGAPRGAALVRLLQDWTASSLFNDLRHVPGLVFEGEWMNDALRARQTILEILSHLPQNTWWSIPALVAAIREQQPDYQRSGGEYDSWFIRKAGSDTFLRGFAAWDDVDGALIHYLIKGPLHWLGILDLAAPDPAAPALAFRASAWADHLWHGRAPEGLPDELDRIKIQSNGALTLPAYTSRPLRYQLARFSAWNGEEGGSYHYSITAHSLERARLQGLRPTQLISLLRKHSATPVPPTLIQALERWENSGTQLKLEKVSLLRATSAEILAAIRKTQAVRFLGEDLNPTTAIVRTGSEDKLIQILAEAGYLAEVQIR